MKNVYMISLIYFFLGYFYPSFFKINNIYTYLKEYLGIYEKLLWIFLAGYGFSMFMKNPNKRVVLKTRLIFLIILGVATGYLYLLNNLKELNEVSMEKIQEFIIQVGLLNINLGYIELYTFLKILPKVRVDIFTGGLIFLIFISLVVICGKMIRKSILSIINFFRRIINHVKEQRRLKAEKIRMEKQAKLEKDIYDEICNIQKIYQEKDILEEEKDLIIETTTNEILEDEIFEPLLEETEVEEFEEKIEEEIDNSNEISDEKAERKEERNDISIQIS